MISAAALLLLGAAQAVPDWAGDARALDRLIADNYAYADRLPGGALPDSPELAAARAAVHDSSSLLHYAEDRMASLADHHAITGRSFRDSWALVPSFADLWIVSAGADFTIDAVRPNTPAATADILAGDRLVAVDGVPITTAVDRFWSDLGLPVTPDRADYAARVLAAGRRDRPRVLTIAHAGAHRQVTLPSLYGRTAPDGPITVTRVGRTTTIGFNDSLGDRATVPAFDGAMAQLAKGDRLVLDLTGTPSGGNTMVARGVMGWFVTRSTGYQIHHLVSETRTTGIARQWVEQVLPRPGKHWGGSVEVRVGRWTGSMGEGMAVGLDAIGARVTGGPMAGLLGAVYDYTLPASGIVIKLPAERLCATDGTPRERFGRHARARNRSVVRRLGSPSPSRGEKLCAASSVPSSPLRS